MTVKTEETVPVYKDCLSCRVVGAVGLIGIGGYLANLAFKNKTLPGRILVSTFSLTFVSLGIARYKQTWPFEKRSADGVAWKS